MTPEPDCLAIAIAGAAEAVHARQALHPLGCRVAVHGSAAAAAADPDAADAALVLVEGDQPGRDGLRTLREL